MTSILEAAPDLDPLSLEQTAALPLGGRVKLDPWSAHIELMKNNRVALTSVREKMPFQVTPLIPYLVRYDSAHQPMARKVPGETRANGRADTVASDRANGQ